MNQKNLTERLDAAYEAMDVAGSKREEAIEAMAEMANLYVVVTSTRYLWGWVEFAENDREEAIEAFIDAHSAYCDAMKKWRELDDALTKLKPA